MWSNKYILELYFADHFDNMRLIEQENVCAIQILLLVLNHKYVSNIKSNNRKMKYTQTKDPPVFCGAQS